MARRLGLVLAVTLAMGAFRAGAEEDKREEGKREEAKKVEIVVGQKIVISDKAATATFAGVVLGREKAMLKVKIEKVEGVTEWKAPKGETGHVVVGEPLAIFAGWEKGEGGKWHPARATMQVFERLRVGDKVEGGIYFNEHPRMAYLTVTARGEGEKHDGDRKREGDSKREGEKKPDAPQDGGDEF